MRGSIAAKFYREFTIDCTTLEYGVLAHGVNCRGVMGAGIALAIKKKWPLVYESYVAYVANANPAELLGDFQPVKITKHLIIVNCFTQVDYGKVRNKKYANVEAIKSSLTAAFGIAYGAGLSLYVPRIGCGLGGLSWEKEVEPVVEALAKLHMSRAPCYVMDLP